MISCLIRLLVLLEFISTVVCHVDLKGLLRNGYYRFAHINFRKKVVDMTKHALSSYMKYAYPADELKPLSCQGRFRHPNIVSTYDDYTLANVSMTLVDSLDTLAIMNLVDEFNDAIKLIIKDLHFDCAAFSSTFELNIRIIGGLVSGHLSAKELMKKNKKLSWYNDELLKLAVDLANKLSHAFQTPTDIPYRMISLKNSTPYVLDDTNCVACGGTYVLEYGALSILTGNHSYLQSALKALSFIWSSRQPNTHLIGTTINIFTGAWTNNRSTIGSDADSYYEYLLKSYVQFSSYKMLKRFDTHYASISKYLKHSFMYYDRNLENVNSSYLFNVDSLRAFFPSLQVLYGDVSQAIIYHQILAKLVKKHIFLPETFSYDYKIINPSYKQRPEFIESTYYLYLATKQPIYQDIATETIDNIEKFLRVPCGYASVENLTSMKLEDRMQSFLLSEMFKYLYLILTPPEYLPFDLSPYIFSTEAHLVPKNKKMISKSGSTTKTCPIAHKEKYYKDSINELWNTTSGLVLENIIQSPDIIFYLVEKPDVSLALEYIRITNLINDLWNRYKGISPDFLTQKCSILRSSSLFANYIRFKLTNIFTNQSMMFMVSLAQFGPNISTNIELNNLSLAVSNPIHACRKLPLFNTTDSKKILLIIRGECTFITKVLNAQNAGASAAVIIDDQIIPPYVVPPLIFMSGDGSAEESKIKIPSVFAYPLEGTILGDVLNGKGKSESLDFYRSSLHY